MVQLGTVDYGTALELQHSLVERRKRGEIGDVLMLLEHPRVITLGRNARAANVIAAPEQLAARGVEVFECDRGGDVTYHGPGQLVGYPIFDLRGFVPPVGAVEFVRRLEEVLIRTCADFGIAAERVAGMTGVWTTPGSPQRPGETEKEKPQGKIAAIGVHISRGVTSHGFALNVNTDLSDFELIVPCGISQKPVTSMAKELGTTIPLSEVADVVARRCSEVFASEVRPVNALDALLGHPVGVPMRAPEEIRKLRGESEETWA
ncbi:MAG TPA: lipoyl(octanoyl) transferase LipB [Terriglobales bacterium]|nr:lipoyl(octanoyl) transferase LipB [Terriglobales bacterium]